MSQPNHDLAAVAQLRGLSGPLLFAVDTLSKPGKIIVHSVRFETIELNADLNFDATQFRMLCSANDARATVLASCVEGK